jgi:hypothetical protein
LGLLTTDRSLDQTLFALIHHVTVHPRLFRRSGRPCVYRQLKRGRSGDEVRPGWRVN